MNGNTTREGSQRGHVQEHVLAGAALQLLNGEAPALKASAQNHLAACDQCAARLEELSAVLAGERQDVADAADAVFTDGDLQAQQASILARLERERAAARVLAFPARTSWMVRRDRPATRWLAAAAAAGLLVGLGAGQVVFTGHQLRFQAPTLTTRDWTPTRWLGGSGAVNAAPAHHIERLSPAAEEAFLSDMESALNSRRIQALRALDDLTPRSHDTPKGHK
jgi:hypothetical protein